jgi:hypothetical protein
MEQSAALGQFLEETFQLQRLVVATGQKPPPVDSFAIRVVNK